MVAPHRRGAAPPGNEVLGGNSGEKQRELQHGGGRQLRHGCLRCYGKPRQVDVEGVGPRYKISPNATCEPCL